MSKGNLALRGVFPPIPTPFRPDGEVAYEALQANLIKWGVTDLAGYVVLGSNGESAYLDDEEKRLVLKAARDAIPRGKLMIAGTGCESTRATIALTQAAADLGADAALVLTPNYYDGKMGPEELTRHFGAVADASPIPVLLYNMPTYTHVDMAAATVVRVAAHPTVVGIKDSGGNITKIGDMVRLSPPGFQVLAGSAGFLLASLVVGAVGGVVALANIAPRQCVQIQQLFDMGQIAEAAELQRRMIPVNAAITATYGVAGLKAAMDMLGYYGGPVRPPLLDLAAPQQQELEHILEAGGLL